MRVIAESRYTYLIPGPSSPTHWYVFPRINYVYENKSMNGNSFRIPTIQLYYIPNQPIAMQIIQRQKVASF